MSRDKPVLRRISTLVVGAREGSMNVGSATATACRGDSGGPMLVERGGGFRVAGVIHGAQGAICASPTEVVPVSPHRDWLLGIAGASRASPAGLRLGVRILLSVLLVSAVVVASRRWRRAQDI